MRFNRWTGIVAALFVTMSAFAVPSAAAQTSKILGSADYVGKWVGNTDWRGVDGFDSVGSWWDFRSDGTFVDNSNETGTWSVGSDGYVNFVYSGGGQSKYTGTIIGTVLLGSMTNGSANGVFALRRYASAKK
jgi:hypothetical protein